MLIYLLIAALHSSIRLKYLNCLLVHNMWVIQPKKIFAGGKRLAFFKKDKKKTHVICAKTIERQVICKFGFN